MLRCEGLGIAELDILGGHNAWPLGAGTQEPAALTDDVRRVEGVARDEELYALTST